jgi:hypothetical protein
MGTFPLPRWMAPPKKNGQEFFTPARTILADQKTLLIKRAPNDLLGLGRLLQDVQGAAQDTRGIQPEFMA